jgi:hypothetical protein
MLTNKKFSKSKPEHNGHKSKNHVFFADGGRRFWVLDIYKCPKSICDHQTQNRFFFVFSYIFFIIN